MGSNDLSQKERQQLQTARDYLGTYNDPTNTVIVKFGNAPGNAGGYIDKDGNIVLDVSKAQREAHMGTEKTALANTENALARNLAHEADHAVRFASREAWKISRHALEVEGYRVAAIYQKGSGWLDGAGNNAWSPIRGVIDEDVLSAQASFSVHASCGTSACE